MSDAQKKLEQAQCELEDAKIIEQDDLKRHTYLDERRKDGSAWTLGYSDVTVELNDRWNTYTKSVERRVLAESAVNSAFEAVEREQARRKAAEAAKEAALEAEKKREEEKKMQLQQGQKKAPGPEYTP